MQSVQFNVKIEEWIMKTNITLILILLQKSVVQVSVSNKIRLKLMATEETSCSNTRTSELGHYFNMNRSFF